jgi:cysteine desulfurase
VITPALAAVKHRINGDPARTKTHVVNVSFPGVDTETLMLSLREQVAISNESACTSASYLPGFITEGDGA